MDKWLDLHKQAWEASSAFVDANYREDWDYSIKAFRGEHAPGSKYLDSAYAGRSKLFRPKTRSVVRKVEAAAAAALFGNMEIVDLQPEDPDNPMSVASRDAMKAVLEYRLGRTIPWFETCMGGIQDAQTQGAVVSYQYWEYDKKKKIDKPCIELRPIENIRLDGGASWVNPVHTSPYFMDIIPMYVSQVRAMMKNKDEKTGAPKWKKFDDAMILKARPDVMDSTRQARLGMQQDPVDERPDIKDFDIVWVMRCFMKDELNDDYFYYSLGVEELLTDPVPIEEAYFHAMRPYEMGYAILETHKVFKTSTPVLVRPLQQEMNEIANQRIDNVKFVLNKRWMVARGRQVDVNSLVRNVPGGVTLVTDPKTDIQESNWPDVTSSSYVEQDRLNADFDDVAGNFSPATKFANKGTNDTLGGTKIASQGAGLMTDYTLRTVIETWVEKVLRQLIKLEAYYESDERVLALAAKKAKLFPRYGLSTISDQMLQEDMLLTVNVGMGASNPAERFQKLIFGTQSVMQVIQTAPPNFNIQEFIKEAYSNMGYRDGSRFWGGQDPRLEKAMQMIQQLTQQLQGKGMELQAQGQLEQQKLLSNERIKAAELDVDRGRIAGDLQIRAAELEVEKQRLQLEAYQAQLTISNAGEEHQMKVVELGAKIEEAQSKLEAEKVKLLAQAEKSAAEVEVARNDRDAAIIERQTAVQASQNEAKVSEVASKVTADMEKVSGELAKMKESLGQHGQGMSLILHGMNQKKPKPKKISIKKKDGGKKVSVEFDDGSAEELEVG